MTFGQASNATDGLDAVCGEALLPSPPPAGNFDSRLVLPDGTQTSSKDFRSSSATHVIWTMKFQPGSGGYPFRFTWNPAALPSGSFRLKDTITGTTVNVDMKTQNSYALTDTGISSLVIEFGAYTKKFYFPLITQ